MPSHYQVECVRCPGSLVVHADTLKEVLDILLAHGKSEHTTEPYPKTYSGIISSEWFQWTITDARPYEKLLKIPAGP